jgi:hypothetical protein
MWPHFDSALNKQTADAISSLTRAVAQWKIKPTPMEYDNEIDLLSL